jgi:hypothetical protein
MNGNRNQVRVHYIPTSEAEMVDSNLTGDELAYAIFIHALWYDRSSEVLKKFESEWKRHFWHDKTDPVVIVKEIDLNPPATLPNLAIAAFCVELYLKAIYCIETGNAGHGHDLIKLFDALSDESKTRIRESYQEHMTAVQPNNRAGESVATAVTLGFRNELVKNNDSFPVLRYSYEKQDWTRNDLVDVRVVLREVILRLKPAWRKAVERMGTTPTILLQ